MEDTIKKVLDNIKEEVSKNLLYDLMSEANLSKDARNFIEVLLHNGCPASAILQTMFSLTKGGTQDENNRNNQCGT